MRRIPRWLKITGITAGALVLLVVGVYLLRGPLLARPLAGLVADELSAALGGRFTLERVEGDLFGELILVGLRTEEEPPDGALRSIAFSRARIEHDFWKSIGGDFPAALRRVEVEQLEIVVDADRPGGEAESSGDGASGIPRLPALELDGRFSVLRGGREIRGAVAISGDGDTFELGLSQLELPGETVPEFRAQIRRDGDAWEWTSADPIAGVEPHRVRWTGGDDGMDLQASVQVGGVPVTLRVTGGDARLDAKGVDLALLPAWLTALMPAGVEAPSAGAFDVQLDVRSLRDEAARTADVSFTSPRRPFGPTRARWMRGIWSSIRPCRSAWPDSNR